jgi:DNA polymerase-1
MRTGTHELDLAVWPIFYSMTQRGLLASFDRLDALAKDVKAQMEEQSCLIEQFCGREVNPASGDDVAKWLATEGIAGKRTPSGRLATDERSMGQLPQHPGIDAILEHRGLKKLLGTFIEPTIEQAQKDVVLNTPLYGKVHPKWKLTRVKSGRVACEDPNLLAFPSRTEIGKKMRSCFIARPGFKMLSIDYSQLEPRIVAALSGDPSLLGIFADDRDLYTEIAAMLNVTRTVAKTLTLGILYGMGEKRLFEQLVMVGCVVGTPPIPVYDIPACGGLIKRWFDTYPGVKKLVEKTLEKARSTGHATTHYGRERYLPGLFVTGNRWPASFVRQEAERQAFNHLIQGTGMECLKRAMVAVDRAGLGLGCHGSHGYVAAYPLLAIHDELIYEVPESTAGVIEEAVTTLMSVDFEGVKLKVSSCLGDDWGELK